VTNPPDSNYAFVTAFVDELARSGLRHVCLSPGSRSTPLAFTVAACPRLKTWLHLDERSSAYFALGMARALGEPVALVCTSGTAAANYFPAAAEARFANVPLLMLTADRPPELLDCGANQTIDQVGMYGSHVKWSVNLPVPDADPELLRYVRAVACRAMATAARPPAGPVHINLPFREPLLPGPSCLDMVRSEGADATSEGRAPGQVHTRFEISPRPLESSKLKEIAGRLGESRRGVVVCGPQSDPDFASAITSLASRLNYPVLADPLSQVRCGPHERGLVVDCYDAFLRDEGAAHLLEPEVVLQFGAAPTSKSLLTYLRRNMKARRIVVQDENWGDPLHSASEIICAGAAGFAEDLANVVSARTGDGGWTDRWQAINSAARIAIDSTIAGMDSLFEGRIFAELATVLPSRANLFAGNSMPVRDMDSFFPRSSKHVRFFCNRGASGIDGVVSSALGASAVLKEPLVLVIGDLSFYHDMNGLMAARLHHLNATIILVNNDGGGIFSFLPPREHPEFFEKCFGTPHGLTFGAAASLYGLGYSRVNSWKDFNSAVSASINSPGTAIVEVPSERERNAQLHSGVWSAVAMACGCIVEEAA